MTFDLALEAVKRTVSPAARGPERQAALNAAREALKLADNRMKPGPGPDLRANAFVGAWERIEAAQKLKVDPKDHTLVDPLPEIYWATIAEAAVLAQLAIAEEDPGRDAGRHLIDRKNRTIEQRAHFADAIRRRKPDPRRVSEADPPFAEGQRVRVTVGDWTGRLGTITKVYPKNDPPLVDVGLDLLDLSEQLVDITVLPAHIELIGADQ